MKKATKTTPMPDLAIEYLPLTALVPYARNARTHSPAQVSQIAASVREFGWTNPVLIDEEGGIIAGHGRVMAAQQLGMDQVPCIRLLGLTKTQQRAYTIADNRLALNAGWDTEMLAVELDELLEDDFDLDLLGFEKDELNDLIGTPNTGPDCDADPDAVPEPQSAVVTKPGDVWVMGKHRVICGDCRDFGTVEKLIDGAQINVAVTSPPYAAQREYDVSSGFKPIPPDDYVEWYADVAANIMAHLADDGSYFCNIKEHCDDGQRSLYVKDLTLAHVRQWGWRFVDELIWKKPGLPGGWDNRFKNDFEPVFHYCTQQKIKFYPRSVGHASDSIRVYERGASKSRHGNITVEGEFKTGIARPSNVIEVSGSDGNHPAAYPVALPEFFIKAFSDMGDVIFDPFTGSGTTLIAAEKNGRRCFGCEISPLYCDVIVRRWQDYTGLAATLDGDGRTFAQVEDERALNPAA